MTSVGVRELRQRASELLRRVERGETVQVTDRGRPVAFLTPILDEGPWARLRRTGQVEAAEDSADEFPEPLVLPEGAGSASAVLARLRRDER